MGDGGGDSDGNAADMESDGGDGKALGFFDLSGDDSGRDESHDHIEDCVGDNDDKNKN